MATAVAIRHIAQAICRTVTRDCVMDEKPKRPICTAKNCLMVKIARRAVDEALKQTK